MKHTCPLPKRGVWGNKVSPPSTLWSKIMQILRMRKNTNSIEINQNKPILTKIHYSAYLTNVVATKDVSLINRIGGSLFKKNVIPYRNIVAHAIDMLFIPFQMRAL